MRHFCPALLIILLGLTSSIAQTGPAQNSSIKTSGFALVETLSVDATDAPRKVLHVQLTIPATPGDFVLVYPKWIPGNHRPTGPVVDTAGMYFRAAGHALTWHRDPVNMYAFHVDVPSGVTEISASFDFLSPIDPQIGFSASASATDKLAAIGWNCLLLYPSSHSSDEIGVRASLKLPFGWQSASALPVSLSSDRHVEFELASLTTLVDSPVLIGQYIKKITLQAGQTPSHELDMVADSAAALEITPAQIQGFNNLVTEAHALYGAGHYRDYHFLLTLSDHIKHSGLEHHESSDNRIGENYLTDPNQWTLQASLLPHEFTHSWNGKYRRPAGLATPDYQTPMKGELLWVYEGLTTYFGYVLTSRSGLVTPEQSREELALMAMADSTQSGRDWRPLEDTATASQLLYDAHRAYSNYRRGPDFYNEGALIWLEVDTIIRQQSGGRHSIDDFAHLFFGGPGGAPELHTYTFDDVVNSLNTVQPYDWRTFLTKRVINIAEAPALSGITNSGWKLTYTDQPNAIDKLPRSASFNATASLGLLLAKDGTVIDAIEGGIAAKHGIGPGMRIIAVNERKHSSEVLLAALREAQHSRKPIQFLVENNDYYRTISLDYYDGPRYPHLVRDESKPDLLTDILKPHVTSTTKH